MSNECLNWVMEKTRLFCIGKIISTVYVLNLHLCLILSWPSVVVLLGVAIQASNYVVSFRLYHQNSWVVTLIDDRILVDAFIDYTKQFDKLYEFPFFTKI